MAEPDISTSDASTVIQAAETHNEHLDYQAAYDLLFPLLNGNELHGAQQGRAALALGDACWGLGSNDAALSYYEEAVQHATGDHRARAQHRVQEINHYDAAVDADGDGVAGEREGAAALRAADEALERNDFDTAWQFYSHAYAGIQMSNAQVSHAAFGMARCYMHHGDAGNAAEYLGVAESRDPAAIRDGIAALRTDIQRYNQGTAATADGVTAGELSAVNLAVKAAVDAGNYDTAIAYLRQMHDSPGISGTERGRISNNLGVCLIYTHDYDAAMQYLEFARDNAGSVSAAHAREAIGWLERGDRAADLVATVVAEEGQ
jgi:Tetratricopeptide repeat